MITAVHLFLPSFFFYIFSKNIKSFFQTYSENWMKKSSDPSIQQHTLNLKCLKAVVQVVLVKNKAFNVFSRSKGCYSSFSTSSQGSQWILFHWFAQEVWLKKSYAGCPSWQPCVSSRLGNGAGRPRLELPLVATQLGSSTKVLAQRPTPHEAHRTPWEINPGFPGNSPTCSH